MGAVDAGDVDVVVAGVAGDGFGDLRELGCVAGVHAGVARHLLEDVVVVDRGAPADERDGYDAEGDRAAP